MNRIYYQGSFKLATDWPKEPSFDEQSRKFANESYIPECENFNHCAACRNLPKEYQACPCDEAIASAMENGVEFADQEKVKLYVLKHWKDRQRINFQYGDNWDCPENVEIKEKCQHNGIHNSTCIYSKVAILKSESVEKKEKWKIVTNGFGMSAIKLTSKKIKVLTPSRYSIFTLDELQSIADRLNQSTPKE